MIVVQAFRLLHKHIRLILYPIIYDLFALVIGLKLIGFYGESTFSIRIISDMGLPSISHLLNVPLLANSVEFLQLGEKVGQHTWLVIVFLVVAGAFLQGGYIGTLHTIVNGRAMLVSDFLKQGKKHWIQFILLELIVIIVKIMLTTFLVFMFQIIGITASFLFFIVIRVLLIYLEFTIVIDNVSVDKACRTSYQYLKETFIPSITLILIMYVLSSGISAAIHWVWAQWLVIGSIFIYGYLMSGIQLAFMTVINQVKQNRTFKP